jgi:hypothetical protein
MKRSLLVSVFVLFSIIKCFSQTLFVPNGFTSTGIGSSSNTYVGIGTNAPKSMLDVNGNIQITNASIPMGLMTEVGGTTPLLNLSVNFREPNKNASYLGAAFRIDTRSAYPLFNWIERNAGGAENLIMSLSNQGNLGISGAFSAGSIKSSGNLKISTDVGEALTLNSTNSGTNIIGFRYPEASTAHFYVLNGQIGIDSSSNMIIKSFYGNVNIKGIDFKVSQGNVYARQVVVQTGTFPDYVFEKGYKLKNLAETEAYIKKYRHLEGFPTEAEAKDKGINVAEMNTALLKKVEEITLLMIEQNKRIEALEKENERLKAKKR